MTASRKMVLLILGGIADSFRCQNSEGVMKSSGQLQHCNKKGQSSRIYFRNPGRNAAAELTKQSDAGKLAMNPQGGTMSVPGAGLQEVKFQKIT
jgi:hypothetical protein